VVSTIALWTLVLTLVFSGGLIGQIGSWGVITVFGLLAQWEFYCAVEGKGVTVHKRMGVVGGFLLFLSSLWFLILQPELAHYSWVAVSAILVLSLVVALNRLVVFGYPDRDPLVSISLTMTGLLYVPYLFNYTARVAFLPGHGDNTAYVLLYLLVVTKFSDAGAYLFGSICGRHQMSPGISPGKTWEGFAGGTLASLGMSLLLVGMLPDQVGHMRLIDAVILGLLLPIAAAVGDLAESVVKRDARIKDSGHSIPGIGGALDLIDSILFTGPLLYFYLYFVTLA